jgi:hypothetical protein
MTSEPGGQLSQQPLGKSLGRDWLELLFQLPAAEHICLFKNPQHSVIFLQEQSTIRRLDHDAPLKRADGALMCYHDLFNAYYGFTCRVGRMGFSRRVFAGMGPSDCRHEYHQMCDSSPCAHLLSMLSVNKAV